MKLWRYFELEKIQHLPNEGRVLLGNYIYFEEKRDGSCLAIWRKFETGKIAKLKEIIYRRKFWNLMISSRNQEVAEKNIKNDLHNSGDESNIIQYLMDNPTHMVFGELLRKGLSPTRMETHEKVEYIVFDIFDGNHFLNYQLVHQVCYHYGMKCVRLFGEGRFISMESLYDYRDKMLEICKQEKREGIVGKTFTNENQPLFFKEKLDTAKSRGQPKFEKGRPIYPPLTLSETLGAIDKTYADLGEKFSVKKIAMPVVAKYIQEEMRKHMCSTPEYDFYRLYCDYCNDHHIEQKETIEEITIRKKENIFVRFIGRFKK